ncbi:ATP synthase subunit I [Mesoaciditoga sp.]
MKSDSLSWSLNLWSSFTPAGLFLFFLDWRIFLSFLLGTIGSQLSLLLMAEDANKVKEGKLKSLKFGFLKRYTLSAVILLFSSIFGIKGLIFAFFGLELARFTLITYVGSGKT